MKYAQQKSNYDKFPTIKVGKQFDSCLVGWQSIANELEAAASKIGSTKKHIVVECYNGVLDNEVKPALATISNVRFIDSADYMLPAEQIYNFFKDDITEDEIFGYITRHNIDTYFDATKVAALHKELTAISSGTVIIYGVGAAYIAPTRDILVYADIARWELQLRYRKNIACNVGAGNFEDRTTEKYKRGFFVDWRILDRFKRTLIPQWNYLLDTNKAGEPKMCSGEAVRNTLKKSTTQPFRVVPFFDPGPWGGQWMKEICDLNRDTQNFAWCFDCVPEENSLLLQFSNTVVEIPSIDLVFAQPRELLGDKVHARFGDEFPIRFDFLDTMEGGNLSLQVHPLTEYIQQKFGMNYTQDESYYMLDAAEGAVVYLGMKNGADGEQMFADLNKAQQTGEFDAAKYVGVYPVKKHDHILIPAGTIHCSGSNGMVLEISSTPYIFTFKLWDWGRLGLDGRPRPINIAHGEKVVQWDRDEDWTKKNIINNIEPIASGDGWREERTGLHEREFIETRRFWFTGKTQHNSANGVQVLNLIEGREVIVESPSGAFEPMTIHYAETFIVPANVGEYTITPCGESIGKECGVIKAFVRTNP